MPGNHQSSSERIRYFYAASGFAAIGQGLVLSYILVYLHDGLKMQLAVAGLALAGAGAVGLIFSSMAGALIDRIGSFRSYELGLVFQGLGALALSRVHNAQGAFLALALAGIGPAIFWPSQMALVAVLSGKDTKTRAYALQFTILNSGVGIGGLISGNVIHLFETASYVRVYIADAGLLLLAVLVLGYGFRGFAKMDRENRRAGDGGLDKGKAVSYAVVFRDKAFKRYVWIHFGYVLFGFSQLEAGWSAFATQFCGATPRVVGLAFALDTGVIVITQLPVARFVDRISRSRALTFAGITWTTSWIMAAMASWNGIHGLRSDLLLIASLGVFGLSETVFSPVASILVNDLAPEELRGRYNAVTSSMWFMTGLFAPPLSALLLSTEVALFWVGPLAIGCSVTAFAASRLGNILPDHIQRSRKNPKILPT